MNWISKTKHRLKRISGISLLVKLYPIGFDFAVSMLVAAAVEQALNGAVNRVAYLGLITIALLVFAKATNTIICVRFQKYVTEIKHSCKMALYREYMSNPLYILYETEHGDTLEKISNDFDTFTSQYTEKYPAMLAALIGAVVYFGFICFQDWLIALTLLLISLLQIMPPLIVRKFLQVNYDNCRNIEAKLTDWIVGGYEGLLTIKLYQLNGWWLQKLKKIHQRYFKIGTRSELTATFDRMLSQTVEYILKYGTYGIVGLYVLFGYSILDAGIKAISLSSKFFASVKEFFTVIENRAVAATAEKRIAKLLSDSSVSDSEIRDAAVELKDVSFGYGEQAIIQNCNIRLDSNRLYLIKGANGAGKSTLLKLIAGVIRCDSGRVTIDQSDTASLSPAVYPDKLFYLIQEDPNYDFSAYDLFRMAAPDHFQDALQLAQEFRINDEVIKTVNIKDLSGGEKKKIFLSLALALHPMLLLLDEPTNSLDQAAVQTLIQLLRAYKGTVMIVTHEHCFDLIADQYLVLSNGGVKIER